jgi:succinate dehydrogenase / fumarate reductase cytochrome b subunit
MKTMNNRPKFLNLTKICFPVAAVVSILHRISGVLLSLSLPVLIYLFGLTLKDEQSYTMVVNLINSVPGKLATVFLAWNLAHHFLAGIRFLLIDLDIGISKSAAARNAWLVHFGAAATAVLALGLML